MWYRKILVFLYASYEIPGHVNNIPDPVYIPDLVYNIPDFWINMTRQTDRCTGTWIWPGINKYEHEKRYWMMACLSIIYNMVQRKCCWSQKQCLLPVLGWRVCKLSYLVTWSSLVNRGERINLWNISHGGQKMNY